MKLRSTLRLCLWPAVLALACPGEKPAECENNSQCDIGEVCRDGACVVVPAAGEGEGEGEGNAGEGEGEGDAGEGEGDAGEGEGEGDAGEGEGEGDVGFVLRSGGIVAGGGVQRGGAFVLTGAVEAVSAGSSAGGEFTLRSRVLHR